MIPVSSLILFFVGRKILVFQITSLFICIPLFLHELVPVRFTYIKEILLLGATTKSLPALYPIQDNLYHQILLGTLLPVNSVLDLLSLTRYVSTPVSQDPFLLIYLSGTPDRVSPVPVTPVSSWALFFYPMSVPGYPPNPRMVWYPSSNLK